MLTYETIYLKASEKCHGNQDDKSYHKANGNSQKSRNISNPFSLGCLPFGATGQDVQE